MLLLNLACFCGALVGHAWFCNTVVNRLHAVGMSRSASHALSAVWHAFLIGLPAFLALWLWPQGIDPAAMPLWRVLPWWVSVYGAFCLLQLIIRLPLWLAWRISAAQAWQVQQSERLDLGQRLGIRATGRGVKLLTARLPRNEILHLEITEKVLHLPHWPPSLDGLAIAHLSDFHFSGCVGVEYFREVVDAANAMQADMIAVTGDILDRAECFDWLPQTLGRLQARLGVYFVLGNHDQRVDWRRELRELTELGLVHLGGRTLQLDVDGQAILLTGDERPWFGRGPDVSHCPEPARLGGPPRIALAHTPDRLRWARMNDIDLLLAGHTHGGQIRIPLLGPMVAPSHHGVRYASGTFHQPPTVMHVSRGLSGLTPLRWNCPPEITRLVLKPAANGAGEEKREPALAGKSR